MIRSRIAGERFNALAVRDLLHAVEDFALCCSGIATSSGCGRIGLAGRRRVPTIIAAKKCRRQKPGCLLRRELF